MLSFHMLCAIAGALMCSITQVLAKENGGSLVCPAVWSLGEEISLTFYIDRSKYPGVCTGGYSRYPAFEKSTDSKMFFANCSVKYDITQNGNCPTSLGLGECGCTSKNASFYEIKYIFQAHSDYNGWWRPDLACIDERPEQLLSYTLSQGCTNVSVANWVTYSSSMMTSRVTGSSSSLVTESGTPPFGGDKGEVGGDKGDMFSSVEMAGIVVSAALLVILAAIGLYMANLRFRWIPSRQSGRPEGRTSHLNDSANTPGQVISSGKYRPPTKSETPLSSMTTSTSQDSSTEG